MGDCTFDEELWYPDRMAFGRIEGVNNEYRLRWTNNASLQEKMLDVCAELMARVRVRWIDQGM